MSAEKLAEVLREITEACEAEFCGPETDTLEPDDSKVSYPEETCNITFGIIRRARQALAAHAAHAAEQADGPQADAVSIRAKPIEWAKEDEYAGSREWTENQYGFHITFDKDEPAESDAAYNAAWGEGDTENFGTLDEAKQWCQDLIDGWVRDCAVLEAAHPQPSAWRLIETAPKQMKVLVGYRNPHGHWRNVTAIYYPDGALSTEETTDDGADEFAPAGWYETSETHEHIYQTDRTPTHWMPLPAAPRERT